MDNERTVDREYVHIKVFFFPEKKKGELSSLICHKQHATAHTEETHHADVESIQQVKGQGGNEIDKEPSGDVVNADGAGVVHYLTRRAHKSSSKVQQYVCRG